MKNNDPDNDDDLDCFLQAMKDVRPIKYDRAKPVHKRTPPIPKQTEQSERQVLIDMLSDEYEPMELGSGEELLFFRPGLQTRVIRNLKRGHYKIHAELDLHGLNKEAARQAVATFIEECRGADKRCVRIIHGKGLSSKHKGPVLKQMINRWLRQHKAVLAFSSAIPRHGGTGAVYVLLKKL